MPNEKTPAFDVMDPAHDYWLNHVEDTGRQSLRFIQKEGREDGTLHTVQDGTTTEAVLLVLIDRTEIGNSKLPCKENEECLAALHTALEALNRRTADRQSRGVEGTQNA